MSHARLKYGIEYDPLREKRDEPSGTGWIVVVVLIVVAGSFVTTLVRRIGSSSEERTAEDSITISAAEDGAAALGGLPSDPIEIGGLSGRSARVKSLLLRLEKAAQDGDLEMQVSTIEQIRSMGGGDAADIADELLPRLGALNMSRLFDLKNPQWVARVKVRDGDTASRIAREHGSTLLSLKKLNGWDDSSTLVAGREIAVMNHPRFYMVLHLRMRALDLFLNGKMFKRYLMPGEAGEIKLAPGDYRTPANMVEFFRRYGIRLPKRDVDEINMLVPRNVPFNVSST